MDAALSQQIVENLPDSGFQLIVYGLQDDPDLERLLAGRNGIAVHDPEQEIELRKRRIVLVCRESAGQESFADFVSRFFARNIGHIYELRVINANPQQAATDGLSRSDCPRTGREAT